MLAIAVPVLVWALLVQSAWTPLIALVGVASLLWYAVILAGIARTRRMPIDWALRHVIAALCHLVAALVCGSFPFLVDPGSEHGSRLSAVYGLLLLVGWISNYIIGIGSRMAPGVMGLGPAPIVAGRRAAAVFVLLNAGLVGVAASLLAGSAVALRLSVIAPLAAALVFMASAAQRLRA
jgi:hypothetical protein